jgi:uncharacterized protein
VSDARPPFHPGEIEVQRRAGVRRDAARLGAGIQPRLSAPIARFLARQRLAVAATVDTRGRPWASPLTGVPGFLQAVDDRLLRIRTSPAEDDPLAANLRARPEMGLLAVDLVTRQRLRANGRAILDGEGVWLETDQVYGNCPKYIQRRALLSEDSAIGTSAVRLPFLREPDREAIARADTFFIASSHPDAGADASHRGGRPGFVRVIDETHLAFDDYPGNNMFNTLGNLVACPRAGLLFLDFAKGDVLQVTGRTEVVFDARREVRLEIEDVLARPTAVPLRWRLEEPSPFNP